MFKALAGGLAALLLLAAPALSKPLTFPPLSGRVVDNANILSPVVEADLTAKLARIEASTGHQVVVATIGDLQGDEIEDYGYQLGRAWKIGDAKLDDGVVLIVAPTARKVRIEVGYGLEPVLTDALSSVIIQSRILPKFRTGDMEGGVTAGVDAIGAQLALPDDQARTVAQQAAPKAAAKPSRGGSPWPMLIFVVVIFFLFIRGGGGRGGGLGGALPWLLLGALNSGSRRDWGGGGDGGGWGGGGGGGFSGGGGSFGGGGASGGW